MSDIAFKDGVDGTWVIFYHYTSPCATMTIRVFRFKDEFLLMEFFNKKKGIMCYAYILVVSSLAIIRK